jgi:hypothetical protein
MTDRKDYSGPFDPDFRYEDLSKEALVRLVREFALIVHLLDRSMCAAIGMRFGGDVDEGVGRRGVGRGQPGLRRAPAPDHGHRRRRRLGHLQGPPARPRLPPPLHGRPLRGGRRDPRVLRAGPLRGAHGRRALRRRHGDQHVPPHRGRHLRRHRAGRQPQGPHQTRPPSTAGPRDRSPHCRWEVVIDDDTETLPEADITRITAGTTAATFAFPPCATAPPTSPNREAAS